VAQVDAPGERHVAGRVAGMAQDDDLLVVAAHPAHPLVEHHDPTAVLDRLVQRGVLLLGEAQAVPVGPPDEPGHAHAAAARRREQLPDRRPVLAHPLVRVAPPVGEEQVVAPAELLDRRHQPVEVDRPVDERFREVARRPGRQPGGGVPPLVGGEQPVPGVVHPVITTRR
jgi:hypothetical protein